MTGRQLESIGERMADEESGHDIGEALSTADGDAEDAASQPAVDPVVRRRPKLSEASPQWLALCVGLAMIVALGALCGWLGYRVQQSLEAERFRALVVQAGRQAAVNLTTIDYESADADVQRILDSATGEFYDDFKARSGPFVDVVKKVQSKSTGTVTEAGLESVTAQEGQVLVAVTVRTTNKGTPDEEPRYWRMRMTVVDDGKDAKVSKVDFVS